MKRRKQVLLTQLEDIYPAIANLGHVLLLGSNTTTEVFTTNFGADPNNVLVANSALYGSGARVRFFTTNLLPAPLVSGVDYWVSDVGGNALEVYSSFDNFVAIAPIVLTANGTGVHTLVEQQFSEALFLDGVIPFSAIAKKEITHADYSRLIYNYSVGIWEEALKEAYGVKTFVYTKSPAEPPIAYRYVALAIGSNATVGNSAVGVIDSLHDFVTPQSITTAQALNIQVSVRG